MHNLLYWPVNHGKWFFNTTQPDCSVQTGEGGLLYIPVYPNYVSKSSSVVRPLTYQRSLMSSTPNIVYTVVLRGAGSDIIFADSTRRSSNALKKVIIQKYDFLKEKVERQREN